MSFQHFLVFNTFSKFSFIIDNFVCVFDFNMSQNLGENITYVQLGNADVYELFDF